jgi:hypothetical protein
VELSEYIEICPYKRDYDLTGDTQLAFVEDAEIEIIDRTPLTVGALSCSCKGMPLSRQGHRHTYTVRVSTGGGVHRRVPATRISIRAVHIIAPQPLLIISFGIVSLENRAHPKMLWQVFGIIGEALESGSRWDSRTFMAISSTSQ